VSARLVWAQSTNGVIGVGGTLPWHLPEDLKHFSRLTAGSVVVMGRRTWESLPDRFRPLPGRTNVVLTRHPGYEAPGAEVLGSVAEALDRHPDPWVIGGAEVYAAFAGAVRTAVVTTVDLTVDEGADDVVRAPGLGAGWVVVERVPEQGWTESSTGLRFAVTTLSRV
jgi:dihydrofolate reductase